MENSIFARFKKAFTWKKSKCCNCDEIDKDSPEAEELCECGCGHKKKDCTCHVKEKKCKCKKK